MKNHENYNGQALITLSYDDGRVDNYEVAIPLHKKYEITASFAIIAGRLISPKRWNGFMSPWQVCEAYSSGFEIVSHGFNHKRLPDISREDMLYELNESKSLLAGFLGNKPPRTICIPFSTNVDYVLAEARNYYDLVRIHGAKLNDIDSKSGVVFSFGLRKDTDLSYVEGLIENAIKEKKWLVLMLHGVIDVGEVEAGINISSHLLEGILKYLSLNRDRILPVSFDDVLNIRESLRIKNELNIKKANKKPITEKVVDSGLVIDSSSGYMITYYPGSIKNKVMISFGGMPSKKKKKGFGSDFSIGQGYEHIFVAQEEGSQYQRLSLEQFKKAVSPYIEGKDVYTYGSSLGGYCAIYFGGCINAKIIAAAPKNSAHPDYLKPRFNDLKFNHGEIVNNPISDKAPVVFFDPQREEESIYIRDKVIPAYPNATYIKMPFAGHALLHSMLESGVLKKVINSIVETGYPCEFSLIEEGSYIWHAEKGRFYFNERKFDIALSHLLRSINIKMNKDAVNLTLKIYYNKREMKKGIELIRMYDELLGIGNSIQKNLLIKFGYEL